MLLAVFEVGIKTRQVGKMRGGYRGDELGVAGQDSTHRGLDPKYKGAIVCILSDQGFCGDMYFA